MTEFDPTTGERVGRAPKGEAEPWRAGLQEQAGILRALFDVRFNTLLTPKLVRAVYVLAIVFIGLGLLVLLIGSLSSLMDGLRHDSFKQVVVGLGGLVFWPLVSLVCLAYCRVALELVIVIFKIKEYAGVVAEAAGQGAVKGEREGGVRME